MKNALLAGAAVALAASIASAASAGVYSFSYSAPGVSGSGIITTGGGSSPYTITNISGTANGEAITGLSSYASADNRLYISPGHPFVDFSGIAFSTASLNWGIGWTGSAYGIVDSISNPSGGCCGITPLNFTVSSVPEPATWAMLMLGAAMIGFAARRRSEHAAVTA